MQELNKFPVTTSLTNFSVSLDKSVKHTIFKETDIEASDFEDPRIRGQWKMLINRVKKAHPDFLEYGEKRRMRVVRKHYERIKEKI
jgi:hypothetical protein